MVRARGPLRTLLLFIPDLFRRRRGEGKITSLILVGRREPRRGELSRIASNSAVPSRLNPAPLSESGEGRPAAVLGVAGVRVGDGEVTSRRRASEPSRRGPGAVSYTHLTLPTSDLV